MPADVEATSQGSDLLYPFYLDDDMSMAFAAALAGGVAMESEEIARVEDASKAVKSLRGSLRFFGVGDLGAAGERATTTGRSDESTLIRRHTAHSIFIDLHDELRSTGRLKVDPSVDQFEVGDLISMRLSPAIAPLRRVIEQVVRLLDVMAPVLGQNDGEDAQPVSRQDRRQKARQAARASTGGDDDGAEALTALRNLFVALRDDLEHSGMIDVVVNPEDGPGVVLTLDKRFADQTALELLHTSNFTVVGKVTRVWPANDDVVFLYRRSVLSLLPALSQQVVVGVFAFLFGMAKAIGVVDFEKEINAVLGQSGIGSDGDESAKAEQEADGPEQDRPSGTGAATEARGPDADADTAESGAAEAGDSDDDFRVGDDIVALNPVLEGPAVQVLPLALCI